MFGERTSRLQPTRDEITPIPESGADHTSGDRLRNRQPGGMQGACQLPLAPRPRGLEFCIEIAIGEQARDDTTTTIMTQRVLLARDLEEHRVATPTGSAADRTTGLPMRRLEPVRAEIARTGRVI